MSNSENAILVSSDSDDDPIIVAPSLPLHVIGIDPGTRNGGIAHVELDVPNNKMIVHAVDNINLLGIQKQQDVNVKELNKRLFEYLENSSIVKNAIKFKDNLHVVIESQRMISKTASIAENTIEFFRQNHKNVKIFRRSSSSKFTKNVKLAKNATKTQCNWIHGPKKGSTEANPKGSAYKAGKKTIAEYVNTAVSQDLIVLNDDETKTRIAQSKKTDDIYDAIWIAYCHVMSPSRDKKYKEPKIRSMKSMLMMNKKIWKKHTKK